MPWDFILIFLFLVVVLPWRGYVRLKHLLALPSVDTMQKLVLYAGTIAFQWTLAAFVAWRAHVHHFHAADLGLSRHVSAHLLLVSGAGAILVGAFHWFNVRRLAQLGEQAPPVVRALAERILPHSLVELLPYFALAITAGVCEEFIYRGFVMAVFLKLGLAYWLTVLLSSIMFGLAHVYQGRSGVVGTSLLGIAFGASRVFMGGLLPAVAWHSTVDIVAGIAGPRYLLDKKEVTP